MPDKNGTILAAVLPTLLLVPVAAAVVLFRSLLFPDAAWGAPVLYVAAVLAAVNPGMLLCLVPAHRRLSRLKGAYMVGEAVAAEGVSMDTLNRCAAVAESASAHPIGACLRAYCGDVGAPPDKFVEIPGLGVSAQFSNQMIHVGSKEYLSRLGVEVPDIPGPVAHVALEGRALGYYRFRDQSGIARLRTGFFRGILLCCACKLLVCAMAVLAIAGWEIFLGFAALIEVLSLVVASLMMRKAAR